jgi:hypothetical protein
MTTITAKPAASDLLPATPAPPSVPSKRLPDKAVPPPPDWRPAQPVRLRRVPSPASLHHALLIVCGLHLVAFLGIVAASMGIGFLVSLVIIGVFLLGCITAIRGARNGIRSVRSLIAGGRRPVVTAEPERRTSRLRLTPEQGRARLKDDLRFVFAYFPRESLVHLRNNFHRLSYGSYVGPDGTGCLFHILSEVLPPKERIVSRETLTWHFTGGTTGAHRELPSYQPARYLLKAFDQKRLARFGGATLDQELLWDSVEEALLDGHA